MIKPQKPPVPFFFPARTEVKDKIAYPKVLLGELRVPELGEYILPGLSDMRRECLKRNCARGAYFIRKATVFNTRRLEWCVTIIEGDKDDKTS
jgi:hypothetical protein